jgi:uncharacterized membrane protein YtjA (UPF0391 family)
MLRDRAQENRQGGRYAVEMGVDFFCGRFLIAAAFGFTGIAAGAESIAKILFYLFLGIFVVLLIAGIIVGRKVLS